MWPSGRKVFQAEGIGSADSETKSIPRLFKEHPRCLYENSYLLTYMVPSFFNIISFSFPNLWCTIWASIHAFHTVIHRFFMSLKERKFFFLSYFYMSKLFDHNYPIHWCGVTALVSYKLSWGSIPLTFFLGSHQKSVFGFITNSQDKHHQDGNLWVQWEVFKGLGIWSPFYKNERR